MAFDPRTNELAILGEGSKSKTLSGLSLTVWSAQGPQLKLMHSLGMTVVRQTDDLKRLARTILHHPHFPSNFMRSPVSGAEEAIREPPPQCMPGIFPIIGILGCSLSDSRVG